MVPDEYDFRIFQRELTNNFQLVPMPIDVSRDVVDNVYQISFEPKSMQSYVVKSKLKS